MVTIHLATAVQVLIIAVHVAQLLGLSRAHDEMDIQRENFTGSKNCNSTHRGQPLLLSLETYSKSFKRSTLPFVTFLACLGH